MIAIVNIVQVLEYSPVVLCSYIDLSFMALSSQLCEAEFVYQNNVGHA